MMPCGAAVLNEFHVSAMLRRSLSEDFRVSAAGGPRLRMLPLRSGLVLLRLRVLRLDCDVAHRRRAGRAVPVVLARGDEHDVARADATLFSVRSDDTRPLRDDQYLIRRVLVKLVPRPSSEVDDAEVEALRLCWIDDQLSKDLADEQRTRRWLARQITDAYYLHKPDA